MLVAQARTMPARSGEMGRGHATQTGSGGPPAGGEGAHFNINWIDFIGKGVAAN